MNFSGISGESNMDKKGNKENYDDSPTNQSTKSADKSTNSNIANNASIDTSFILNNVNDRVAVQHQSSDQHTEL